MVILVLVLSSIIVYRGRRERQIPGRPRQVRRTNVLLMSALCFALLAVLAEWSVATGHYTLETPWTLPETVVLYSVVIVGLWDAYRWNREVSPSVLSSLPSWMRFPTSRKLGIAWVIAVFTVVGYPFAIYMTWRFARGHRPPDPSLEGIQDNLRRGDTIAAQSLVAMDSVLFRFMGRAMEAAGASTDQIRRAISKIAVQLTHINPDAFLESRHAIYSTASAGWPRAIDEAFTVELARPWAQSAADEETWRHLPRVLQDAYVRQGHAMNLITLRALQSGE